MAVPSGNNISIKEYNKIDKGKDLKMEIEKYMWHLKMTNVRIIMGTLGLIKKETDKHINKITGNLSQYEIKKNVLYETTHLLRKVLST